MTTADPPVPAPARTDLVLELCGLPGSGKTSVAQAALPLFLESGHACEVVDQRVSAAVPRPRRVLRKAAMIAAVIAGDPRGAVGTTRVLGPGQPGLRDRLAVPAQWWVAERLVLQARQRGGLALVEEGLVQALWTAGLRSTGLTPSALVSLAGRMRRADLVVHLDIPAELALERLRARPSRHSRVQRMTPSDQAAAMRHGDALLRELLAEWTRQRLGEVVTVTSATALRAVALDRLSSARRAP